MDPAPHAKGRELEADPPRQRISLTLQFLPLDVIGEILIRCSVESIQNLSSIWPGCRSIVRNPSFQQDYLRHSFNKSIEQTHDEILFASETAGKKWNFASSRILHPQSTSFLCSSSSLTNHMEYSNGLLCSGSDQIISIFNPTIGESRMLPRFPAEKSEIVKSYLGFDPFSWSFKVLGFSRFKDGRSRNHHVLTLGFNKDPCSWRPLLCQIEHLMFPSHRQTKAVCIGSILYYTVYLSTSQIAMILFDMKTETFASNLIPEPPHLGSFLFDAGLFDLKGKVALSFRKPDGKRIIRVLQDQVRNQWSHMIIKTPVNIANQLRFFTVAAFIGFAKSGELVFSQAEGNDLFVYFSNPITDETHKIRITGAASSQIITFWNHVESLMFI